MCTVVCVLLQLLVPSGTPVEPCTGWNAPALHSPEPCIWNSQESGATTRPTKATTTTKADDRDARLQRLISDVQESYRTCTSYKDTGVVRTKFIQKRGTR